MKLNTDGSFKSSSGWAGAGGVLRDSRGDWISGFTANLRKGNCILTEARGLFHGVKLAWSLGFEK